MSDPSRTDAPSEGPEPSDEGVAPRSPGTAWVRFAVGFALLELTFEGLYHAVALQSDLLQGFLEWLATASGWTLTPFYDSVEVKGTQLKVPGFTVEVDYGCDGIQVCTLLMAAVLAFPAPWRRKWIGIAIGLPWMQAWNVTRISTLVAIGKHLGYPTFQTIHVYVWPTALVLISLASWIGWARWATADEP